ncbi:hypothetical protein [Mycobacterium lepromatosis]|uniref:hypothetical protein n=1 Tax=Mycobacterium lepromatosis TaxID=480418 RepID=UPI0005F7D636|nr:hypothetical protein [Mycobacterium lepromatosis]UKN42605.1 hypothetical protein MLPF_2176 [Mycobacterium lepromatosis]
MPEQPGAVNEIALAVGREFYKKKVTQERAWLDRCNALRIDAMIDDPDSYTLIEPKDFDAPSVFHPKHLLRDAHRQKSLKAESVRQCVCSGSRWRHRPPSSANRYRLPPLNLGLACYHTDMWVAHVNDLELGVVGMAFSAPLALLVAEQRSASNGDVGCQYHVCRTH